MSLICLKFPLGYLRRATNKPMMPGGTIPQLYELIQREAAWRQLAGSLARQLTERLILADAAKHTKA